ncbi:hypothetical protein KP509_29G026700 [Ceratopteris richardii]|nr:hypothetical protein KP509_29G026700 [Ceratopteris richardii]
MEAFVLSFLVGCLSIGLLYLLWKHHPSYGGNPAAPAFPFVGSLPFVLLNRHRMYEWTSELFDRSTILTRKIKLVSSISYSTIDPQVVHHILKSKFDSYPKGPNFYPFFADLIGRGIFNCDGSLWRFQRKVASYVFTSASLRDFVVTIVNTEISGRLLPALDASQPHPAEVIDIQMLLTNCMFDITCQFTFGADPACLKSAKLSQPHVGNSVATDATRMGLGDDRRVDMINDVTEKISHSKVPDHIVQAFVCGFQDALQVTAERFLVPQFWWRIMKWLNIGSEKRLKDGLAAVENFTTFVIEQSKRERDTNRRDLLARFLNLPEVFPAAEDGTLQSDVCGDEQEGKSISDSFLRDILLSFILAGRDAVVSGVTFCLWLLCLHPRVEENVLGELRGIIEDRKFSNHEDVGDVDKVGTFTYEEVRKMNYLHAVLSESMRSYPPVPANVKFAAEDDSLPDGTQVFKGTRVSYNAFAMGRAARIWGTDCLEFQPERWLNEHGVFEPANPFKYPVFQAGPRICLGKDLAFIEMKLLMASLIWNFEFALQPGFKPRLSYGVIMLMVNGLLVTVKRRLR